MVPSCASCPTYQQTTIAHDANRTPWTRASIDSKLYTCGQPVPTRSVEYLFIVDGSTSMTAVWQYASFVMLLASYAKDTGVNPIFSVVSVGGDPTVIMYPTTEVWLVYSAIDTLMKHRNPMCTGHEATLEAIRIALLDEPMNTRYGFKQRCYDGAKPCKFKWNPNGNTLFTKNIVAFTDEDSDLPRYVENRNSLQQVMGNQFCATLTQKDYVNESDPTVFCSASASIEPAWEGPRGLYRGKYTTRLNQTVDDIQLLLRVSNEPAVLHPAAQAEVLATARSILRANAMVFLFLRPDNAANPYQPVSSWNSENPLYLGGPTDNKNTAIWQYGDPAL
ncbi:hypothetical protein CXG81DRAFT_21566, partial [Caulochytrium protostelioides]